MNLNKIIKVKTYKKLGLTKFRRNSYEKFKRRFFVDVNIVNTCGGSY
jgi:hypothetical protein